MAYSWCECPIAFDSPEKESPVHTVIDTRNTFALSYCILLFEDIANSIIYNNVYFYIYDI